MKSLLLLVYLGVLVSVAQAVGSASSMMGMEESVNMQREQIERLHDFLGPVNDGPSNSKRQQPASSTITFSNPAAQKFFVDGTKIPDGEYHLRLFPTFHYSSGSQYSGV